MRHIYLNKLYCTCFDFLLHCTIYINTQAHTHIYKLRYKVMRVSARSHYTCCTFAQMYACVCMFECCCLPVYLKHRHKYTHTPPFVYSSSCTVLFVPWLARSRNGSDKTQMYKNLSTHSPKQTSLSLKCVVVSVSTYRHIVPQFDFRSL